MSARRVVLSSFVLVALARATCAAAEDSSDGAVLGPAEPIGKLLVVKAGFDDEPEPLPPAPIPGLDSKLIPGPPRVLFPAHGTALADCGAMLTPARNDPGEIAFHLSQAVLGLTAAGLNEEAERVRSLLSEFETKLQPRLVLAAKRAQLNELQAEIERLKLRVEKGITSDQVQLSVKIIEADGKGSEELLGELAGNDVAALLPKPARQLQSLTSVLDRKEFLRLVESKRKDGSLKVLTEPILVTMSGIPARFRSGGSLPIPQISQAGGPAEELEYGTTVLATATILDKDLIRVALTAGFTELNHAIAVNEIPGLNRRRVQTTLELKDGQTAILGGLVSTTEGKTTELIVTVTAEIIQPDE